MYAIAVLDDRRGELETLMRSIGSALPAEWNCIECPLLLDPSRYSEWLTQNNVLVLIADQVLNERARDSLGAVDYKGHEVISSIRKTFPNFPVFIVTAHPEDPDLPEHWGEAEDVMTRAKLTGEVEKYVMRMVRSGQRFHAEHERQLADLSDLAMKVASGTATDEDKEALKKLQVSLGTQSAASLEITRQEALDQADKKLAELERLRTEIEQVLSKEGRK